MLLNLQQSVNPLSAVEFFYYNTKIYCHAQYIVNILPLLVDPVGIDTTLIEILRRNDVLKIIADEMDLEIIIVPPLNSLLFLYFAVVSRGWIRLYGVRERRIP